MNHAKQGLPGGTVTFFFSDIEASTALWQAHPQGMRAALARHDEIVRLAVEESGGTVIKNTGDGLYAVFPSAGGAVEAALATQKAPAAERVEYETEVVALQEAWQAGRELTMDAAVALVLI